MSISPRNSESLISLSTEFDFLVGCEKHGIRWKMNASKEESDITNLTGKFLFFLDVHLDFASSVQP